ncbi:MAG: AmmeMemoRadiSam system radical SAM enzyme [bacterium]
MKTYKTLFVLLSLITISLLFAEESKITPYPAKYWEALGNKLTQCTLCPRRCIINPAQRGVCGVRENKDGKLFTMVYGVPCAVNIDPIEKKPLFHFLPGSTAFSIATAGCNLKCKFCQNWDISQSLPEHTLNIPMQPDEIVKSAKENGCLSLAFTYSEPTIFYEYMFDIVQLAHKAGIKNTMHSSGYINPEPLKALCKYLDAANIDLKGFTEEYYQEMCLGSLTPVLQSLKILKKEGVWLEITNLIIPTKNDDSASIRKMCEWIRDSLGADVPLHFSRFWPMYKLKDLPPTPITTLERACKIAKKAGLKYVYIGNIPGNASENTYCPSCRRIVIKRKGYYVMENDIMVNGKCKFCGKKIAGVWK